VAGGIDWFRWHHGSVNDQKFQLVAKKAGASVADVIAVWACLLEAASMADERGNPGEPDHEAIDCALGLPDGRASAIYAQMRSRELIAQDGRLVAWSKRQPKREREDDNSTERVKAFRDRQRQETPRNATERQETPREEKSREEEKETPAGFARFWSVWPKSPRKEAKGKCLEAWRKAGAESRADLIVAHIERLKRSTSWTKDAGQFIPAPLVYLNNRRWEGADDASNEDDPYGLKKAVNA
jgi:hypothetical protein